jgi:hypothetical protein
MYGDWTQNHFLKSKYCSTWAGLVLNIIIFFSFICYSKKNFILHYYIKVHLQLGFQKKSSF